MTEKSEKGMLGNKGEWSELYTFLKLLSDGRLYAANENIEKMNDTWFSINKIIRNDEKEEIEYIIREDDVIVESHALPIAKISRKIINENAIKLLKEISIRSGCFKVEEIEKFANRIKVTKIKAPSDNKADIFMQIEDVNTGLNRRVGFSIKSEVGKSPTLLNAGKTTNFIYKIQGIDKGAIKNINGINTRTKIKDRIKAITSYGGTFLFTDMNNECFKRNLRMIDSAMPEILGNVLLYHYLQDIKECKKLVEIAEERDPINYNEDMMYEYKFKKFLCSCALGMKPSKQWDGIDEANGGYIIVKSDGEVLAYHIYNRNYFENYLLDNTIFERASIDKHDYMNLYEENGEIYIKLNLQIRFK